MAPIAQYAPQLHGIVHDPLAAAMFTLNAFGVAGFFSGETAVNGMATVIFFFRGRWGGLYNTPGSLEIAKRYGQRGTYNEVCRPKGELPLRVCDPPFIRSEIKPRQDS